MSTSRYDLPIVNMSWRTDSLPSAHTDPVAGTGITWHTDFGGDTTTSEYSFLVFSVPPVLLSLAPPLVPPAAKAAAAAAALFFVGGTDTAFRDLPFSSVQRAKWP